MTTQVDIVSRGPKRVRVVKEVYDTKKKVWVRKPSEIKDTIQPVGLFAMEYVHSHQRLVIEEI
jgi:hypothetical protein